MSVRESKNDRRECIRGLRNAIVRAAIASILGLSVSQPILADDAPTIQLQLAPQTLRDSLAEFEKQSGLRIVFSPRDAQGYDAPVLTGRYTPTNALQVLLKGTGLTFRQVDDKTIEVQPGTRAQLIRTADTQGDRAAGATLLAQSNAAGAQTTPAPQSTPVDNPLQEVIVTGSRIARQKDFTSLSPLVTTDAAAIENRSDSSVIGALEDLPQFNVAGNSSSLSSAFTATPSATAAPGAATVDLRGLGTNRTLVLVDGRRTQPVNAALVIDLNQIPSEAVDSVETITGGAAATYGADAIAGVVNIKLKQNFQGVQIDAQQGISQYGDDHTQTFSALMGTNFADNKGNVMFVLNYASSGQADQTKRGWFQAGEASPTTQASGSLVTTKLSQYIYDPSNMPTGAGVYGNPATSTWIDQNGSLFDVYSPLSTGYTGPLGGNSGFKINPNGSLGYNSQIPDLEIPLTRWAALSTAHYNITDHVTAYMEAQFSKTDTTIVGSPSQLSNVWQISVPYGSWDNPSSPNFGQPPAGSTFNPVPQGLATLLNSRANPNAPWTYNGSTDYFGPYTNTTSSSVYQVTAGLRGDVSALNFTKDWTWDVYGSRGESSINSQLNGFPVFDRLNQLFTANMYGQNWTNTGYPTSVGGGCTSGLPIFNANGSVNTATSVSPNCAAYADPPLNNVTDLTQTVYEGDLQGSLVDMPFNAGKLRFAVGADYRSEDFSFTPDSNFTAYQPFPDIVGNISLPVPVSGNTGASEVYTEFAIPVVKDLPFAKSIEIDPGIRYSHYDESEVGEGGNSSGVKTWKLLGNWQVTNWVGFRGGLEVANRAPNIAELFTPTGGSTLGMGIDACGYWAGLTPSWGNNPSNPNRYNVQEACQYLITRDGGPASLMVPGASANTYNDTVFGPLPQGVPFILGISSGNPNLQSETARTVTAGVVLNSPFEDPYTKHMRMTLDWYQIQLDNAIGVPSAGQVYQECLDPQYNNLIGTAPGQYTGAQIVANNPFCAYINREYAPQAGDYYGAARNYVAAYVNQGGIQSRGLDMELDWGLSLADTDLLQKLPGGINVNVVASYLDRYAISPFQGAAYINYTGTVTNDSYRYKVLSTFGYTVGPASVGFRWQHLPGVAADPSSASDVAGANHYNLVDFFTRYSINDNIELRGGVDNLFNAWPEWVGANPSNANVGTTDADYDTIGRRFYLGVKATL